MAANAWAFYDHFPEIKGDGTIDMDADTFNAGLYLSTSNAADLTLTTRASLTNEHAAANGYTQPGSALASVTWSRINNITTFDSADEVFSAAGGSIVARFCVIDDDTVSAPLIDPLCCYALMDNTPADVTVTDTNALTIAMNVNGIATFST